MNEVFLIGKIVNKVDFNFVINSKRNFSKVEFELAVQKQKIKIIGYNEIADYCYQNLELNEIIQLNGKLETNGRIRIQDVEKYSKY